ncbi:unnamed protein product [Meganyctiphanes norvegica]|uniref:ANK_REP_REGION domain-containing protein n=1 Tax=Meganyctiphanes norvegica TaxID=48144 RepID=A0AAV2QSP7_MEGNR
MHNIVNRLLDGCHVATDVITYDAYTVADVAAAAGHQHLAEELQRPKPRDYRVAATMAEDLLERYNAMQYTHMPDTIPKLANRIRKCFHKTSKVDDQDLYALLVHKISNEDNVGDVVRLASLGCPVSPFGDIKESALKLAIDLYRPRTITALLALGADVFLRSGGYNLLRYVWRTPDTMIFMKMIITRMFEHKVGIEVENTETKSLLESVGLNIIKSLKEDPQKLVKANLDILDFGSLNSLLCEAGDRNCSMLATFIYDAGAQVYTHSNQGKTAIHHTLVAQTGMEEMLITHLGCSPYIADSNGQMPLEIMQEKQRRQLEEKMVMMELKRLDNLISSAKSHSKKIKYKWLILLFSSIYVTSEISEQIISWREIYTYILELVKETDLQNKGPITDDRYIWITDICKSIRNDIEMCSFDIDQEYEHIGQLLKSLNQLRLRITRLSVKEYQVKIKDREIYMKTPNHECYLKQALEFACENNFCAFLHMLISRVGVNPETPISILKTSALHHAAAAGNGNIVAYLLHTSDAQRHVINGIDTNNNNAAHYAYMNGKTEIGNYLIKIKPELNKMKNTSGRTPRDLFDAYKERLRNLKVHLCEHDDKEDLRRNLHAGHEKDEIKLNESLRLVCELNNEYELATTHLNMCLWRKSIRELSFEKLALDNLVELSNGENRAIYGEVVRYLNKIGEIICLKQEHLKGTLVPAGSSADGCRLGAPDESDFNWVLELKDIAVKLKEVKEKQPWEKYTHEIMVDSSFVDTKELISGSNLGDKFYAAVENAISTFPKCHDSRLSVVLPGVRKTGVGVALTLAWMGTEHKFLLVDVDLVPVIKTARPDEYPHPPLTEHFSRTDEKHTIHIAGNEWNFSCEDLDAAYISKIDDSTWRFSQALEENYIFQNLNRNQKNIFLICKYIISVLTAEDWYPEKLKKRYKYFSYKLFKLPTPKGFLLKSSFFKEIERVPEEKYWIHPCYLDRIKCIFLHMCRENEYRNYLLDSLVPNNNISVDTRELICGKVPPYFARCTEKEIEGFLAPSILKFLNELDIHDFVSK